MRRLRFDLAKVLWPYLLGALILSGLTARYWPTAIGWNLLAEAIGTTFGVLAIDVALENAERLRLQPAQWAMLREAGRIYGKRAFAVRRS